MELKKHVLLLSFSNFCLLTYPIVTKGNSKAKKQVDIEIKSNKPKVEDLLKGICT